MGEQYQRKKAPEGRAAGRKNKAQAGSQDFF
jgi:hypothetical protein